MWYIHTMEYYTAIRWDETGSSVVTWMNLESIPQNEVEDAVEDLGAEDGGSFLGAKMGMIIVA